MPHGLLRAFGYDGDLLDRLDVTDIGRLEWIAGMWSFSAFLLGTAAGYAAWLVEPRIAPSVLAGLITALLVLNLLRVVQAGGGIPPACTRAEATRATPSSGPWPALVLLGALLFQPLQVPIWASSLAPAVQSHRDELVRTHEQAMATMATDDAIAVDFYRQNLQTCNFAMYAIRTVWTAPQRPLTLTLLFCLVVAFPALLSRLYARASLHHYDLLRWAQARRAIVDDTAATQQHRGTALKQWPTYCPRHPAYADEPFCLRPVDLLRVPPQWKAKRPRSARAWRFVRRSLP